MREKVAQYNQIIEKVVTQNLNLAKQSQTGRVTDEVTNVTFAEEKSSLKIHRVIKQNRKLYNNIRHWFNQWELWIMKNFLINLI